MCLIKIMEGIGFVTPASTIGMGDPVLQTETGEAGSGDIFVGTVEKPKKKKKLRRLKDYLKNKRAG